MPNPSTLFKANGYIPYNQVRDFNSEKTFIVKGKGPRIDSKANADNSSWPNAAHIVLTPTKTRPINVETQAEENLLGLLEKKFKQSTRKKCFIYQPLNASCDKYQKFVIYLKGNGCVIKKDGKPQALDKIICAHDDEERKKDSSKLSIDLFEEESSFKPSQIIFYGVPGCGKSEKIKKRLEGVPEYNKVRVVFHPEYTNAEFIGSILPCVEKGTVLYKFAPGPLSRVLRRAYLNPKQHFYLIVEEINRGHADAIFGETFQLFDRIKSGKDEFGYRTGWSTFPIENMDVSEYVRDKALLRKEQDKGLCSDVVKYTLFENEKDADGKPLTTNASSYESIEINRNDVDIKKFVFSDTTSIRFPPNLSILGTMNTSDQNIFSLDNAFQRRIDLNLVRNEFNPGTEKQCGAKIAGTNVIWGNFWEWINNKITKTLKGLKSTEDKRLGVWFVSNVNGAIDERTFAEKILKYLWDDVFRYNRPDIFAKDIDSLEKLIKRFESPENGKSRFDVFQKFLEKTTPDGDDNGDKT